MTIHIYKVQIKSGTDLDAITYPYYLTNKCGDIARLYTDYIKKVVPKNRNITLICRGLSGMYTAALLQMALRRKAQIIPVRKKGDRHHLEEIPNPIKPYYIFVNDFIFTGKTLQTCCQTFPIVGVVVFSEDVVNHKFIQSNNVEWMMCYERVY